MEKILETERLILRRYREGDLQDLYEYLSDPEVVKYEPYRNMNLEEVREELKERVASGEMIGNVYLGKREFHVLELGYVFNRKFWGCGYAGESCRALMQKAFSEGIHRIYAECDPENENSWKLLQRLGFVREGYLKENVWFWEDEDGNPIWKDTYIYGMVNG